jgi:AraC-like DNA-binding protein
MLAESLTGYIARLAEAHHVPTGVLLTREVHPQLRRQSKDATQQGIVKPNYSFIYEAHILNGAASCPPDWVRALEALTGRVGLTALTMLPWCQIVSGRHLLRRKRAWCPVCFESWRDASSPVYEPLLWAIGFVSVCPLHQCRLQEYCPHCGQNSTVLTAKARPGYCYSCRRWLGTSRPGPSDAAASATSVATAVGELLATGSGASSTTSSIHFKQNLRLCLDEFAGGNISQFARLTNTSWDCLHHWLNAICTVGLDLLVGMCCKLGLSTARFLSETMPIGDPEWEHARQAVCRPSRDISRCRTSFASGPPSVIVTAGSEPPLKRTRDSVRPILEAALRQPNVPSLPAVARQLGYLNPSSLINWHPDLCYALVAKACARRQTQDENFGAAITSLLGETPPLSVRDVSVRIGLPVSAIRKRFPALTAALVARVPERRQCEHDRLAKYLQSTLVLHPAPTMTEVASSLGKSRDYLKYLFPDLFQQIRDRHLQEKKETARQNHQRFRAEIHQSVTDLCQRGIIPSRKRVMASIISPSMRSTHILDQQIAQSLRDSDAKLSAPFKPKVTQL